MGGWAGQLQLRLACIVVPHFFAEIERLEQPALRGRPVVVGGALEESKEVQDCSLEAMARGVHVGMPLREALSRCPEAAFVEGHPDRYHAMTLGIVDVLLAISDGVEPAEPGVFYLDVGEPSSNSLSPWERAGVGAGSSNLDPLERELAETLVVAMRRASGLTARVGIADGKFAAYVAAVLAEKS